MIIKENGETFSSKYHRTVSGGELIASADSSSSFCTDNVSGKVASTALNALTSTNFTAIICTFLSQVRSQK